jgi:hypothetical protein
MPETWIYVAGGIIVAVIAFTIAYNLISSSIEYSQRQNTLAQFSSLYSDINTVCLQEINNSLIKKFSIPLSVRAVYATIDTNNTLPKVTDLIKSEQVSSGQNICLQFKDEQYLRCYPQPPKKFSCNITVPYMGALQEAEDIWVKVSKILGGPAIREYELCIKKVGGKDVNVNFDVENCVRFAATTTTAPGATTTTTLPTCSPDSLVKLVDSNLMTNNIQYLIQQPRVGGSAWNRQTADWIRSQLESYGLESVHFEDFSSLSGQGRNVVGEIGSGSNVIVVTGGHRDTAIGCPGAVDNAAGTVTVLEAARVLATCKNNIKSYKMKFVIFDIEEYPPYMAGSKDYVNVHSNENIKGMINFDCLGLKGSTGLTVYRTDTDLSNSADKACQYLGITCDKRGQAPARSDQDPFGQKGIGYLWAINYAATVDESCGMCYHCVKCQDDMSQIDSKNMEWVGKFAVYVLVDLYVK